MKIVFMNLSLRPEGKRRQLPVGLAYILTAAKSAGFEFDLIDMDVNHLSPKDLEEILGHQTYDIYAMGCIVTGFKLIKEISRVIKRINPDSTVIAGNSVASSIPEILITDTEIDIAVIGEGDVTLVELLKALENKKDISKVGGIAFQKDGRVIRTAKRRVIDNIDSLGFPEWDIFELKKYEKYGQINVNYFSPDSILSYPLNSARGCPFDCTFCYHVFKGEKYRRYSEGAITDEIKRLYHKYNCNFVSFWDELTFPNINSVERMVQRLEKLDFKIGWQAATRGNLFKKKHRGLVKAMHASGCDSIACSLENASPEILAAINKKITVSEFIEQSKVLHKEGVTPLTSVIFGYPQETPETIKLTLKVCEECGIYPSVGFLLPLPGTSIYGWARKNGYITDEVKYLERIGDRQDFHINLTKMPDKEFISTVESELKMLAKRQGLRLESVFKTTTYQKPKKMNIADEPNDGR